ncbi:MAG: calcium:proton antiporter [Methanocalculus sp. MSAO_Arc2]|uniref:cache domain-containing protein n=1 Tax=Methanocalculus sp. MSAO_Arc2 TaxID=2293855 RepID=UPI000FF7DAB0|nr:MAG: calcium:proton antiporter [Methanocalculus sp. MSAO_Arc2]
MTCLLFGALLCLVVFLALSGCVEETEVTEHVSFHEELRLYVLDAGAFADAAGKEAAIWVFGSLDGAYMKDEWYMYAYDYDCILLAHPYQPEMVGTDRFQWTDNRGLPVIRLGRDVSAKCGGYIVYLYPKPGEDGIDEAASETYEPKLGYVHPAGDDWWVASGVALMDLGPGGTPPPAVREMIELVSAGVSYAHAEGRDAALSEITDPNGPFINEPGHYLYAYTYDGMLIGHPYLAAAIGMDLSGKECIYDMKVIQSLAEAAEEGSGFVVFIWPNPDEGNREELKIGYMLPVDDEWWLGSGVYLSEVTGDVYSGWQPLNPHFRPAFTRLFPFEKPYPRE